MTQDSENIEIDAHYEVELSIVIEEQVSNGVFHIIVVNTASEQPAAALNIQINPSLDNAQADLAAVMSVLDDDFMQVVRKKLDEVMKKNEGSQQ